MTPRRPEREGTPEGAREAVSYGFDAYGDEDAFAAAVDRLDDPLNDPLPPPGADRAPLGGPLPRRGGDRASPGGPPPPPGRHRAAGPLPPLAPPPAAPAGPLPGPLPPEQPPPAGAGAAGTSPRAPAHRAGAETAAAPVAGPGRSRNEETVTLRAPVPPSAQVRATAEGRAAAPVPASPRHDETITLRRAEPPAPAGSLPAQGRAARRRAARQADARHGVRRTDAPAGPGVSAPTGAGAGPATGRQGGPAGPGNPRPTAAPRSRAEARRAARARKDSRGAALSRAAGELFITVGVLMLLFVTYQLWWTNIRAHAIVREETEKLRRQWAQADARAPGNFSPGKGFAIMYIPKLDVKVPVAEGIDKHKVLDRGMVGHYSEGRLKTAMPWDDKGNFAVAGHRNTHGEPFRYINRLKPGDEIIVETQDTYFVYEMARILPQTPPSNTAVIGPVPPGSGFTGPGRYITLTTCTPEFTSTYRMIVWGKMVEERPRGQGKPDALVG